MKEYLKQSYFLLDPPAKKAVPFLIGAFIFSSFLDVIGIGLIGVFIGLLTHSSFFFARLPQQFLPQHAWSEKKWIVCAGLLIVMAFIIKAIIALLIQTRVVFFGQAFSVRLKSRLMNAYQLAPYTYHLQKNSAYLLSRIQENINAYINNVLMPTFNLLANLIISFSVLIMLFILHPFSTLFLFLLFGSVGLFYDVIAKRKLVSLGRAAATMGGEMVKSIHQGLRGLVEVRVLGKEPYFLNQLNRFSKQYAHAYGALIAMQQVPRYLAENAMAIFIVGLSLTGMVIGVDAGSTMAMVGMFAAAGARLLPTVSQILTAINQIRGSSFHMALVCNELKELDALIKPVPDENMSGSHMLRQPFKQISLQDIYYTYPHARYPALQQVNLTLLKGQSVGLIGQSGAGKSTLINVLLGFVQAQQGKLLVDGLAIHPSRAWLDYFAYIPQTIFLLDDTFKRNIALGVDDADIDPVRLNKAVQLAQLIEVVAKLPHGLETQIGENGVRLSGGQRQRIALARAFYHERDVIIMDEATSSLDNETENEVIQTIKRLKGNKTLLVIAHRLSTVEHCDVLYRLADGMVTAVGSFQEVAGVAVS